MAGGSPIEFVIPDCGRLDVLARALDGEGVRLVEDSRQVRRTLPLQIPQPYLHPRHHPSNSWSCCDGSRSGPQSNGRGILGPALQYQNSVI